MQKLTTTGYVVVRNSDNRDWLDMSTYSGLPEDAKKSAMDTNHRIPTWANVNRLLKIVQIKIEEI